MKALHGKIFSKISLCFSGMSDADATVSNANTINKMPVALQRVVESSKAVCSVVHAIALLVENSSCYSLDMLIFITGYCRY